MSIREILLKNLSRRQIRDICDFVEQLYLMEYDLMVLMARKFFNLFCVFHEINCEKYGSMGIPYIRENKTIVTDRALPLLQKRIGKVYKKIIIADDIIIYGRSIKRVYNEIKALCPEIDIYLACYMKNDQEKSECDDIQEKVLCRYLVKSDEWRMLSDEIVQIFYLSGRPYISYLPYYSLEIDWNTLLEGLDSSHMFNICCDDMKHYGISSFMYTGSETEKFGKLPFLRTCCLRFYHYRPANKILVIPYCSADVLEDGYLQKLSDYIRERYYTKGYLEFVNENDGADPMRIMELEYVLSAWLAEYFFQKKDIKRYCWHRDIETYNFVTEILPDEIPDEKELQGILTDLMDFTYEKVTPKIQGYDEELSKGFEELEQKYLNELTQWAGKGHNDVYENYIQRFLENYLRINGMIDDESYNNYIRGENSLPKERHYGLPISYILNNMKDMYKKWGEKSSDECMKKCYAAILCAADSGKGTIVTRHLEENGLSESLIYAGEQNYKFYENTNFPFLYGLYIIEQKGGGDIDRKKNEFRIKFTQYLEKENIFYRGEEMQQILDLKASISELYGQFLMNSYNKHMKDNRAEKAALEEAVNQALKICGYM